MSNPDTAMRLQSVQNEQGDATRVEIRCSGCGFGAVVSVPPARCPMCGNSDWGRLRTSRVDGRLTRSMTAAAINGSQTHETGAETRASRRASATNYVTHNSASHGDSRRKEQVMEGLDSGRTAGR